jgi:hypothetical protein
LRPVCAGGLVTGGEQQGQIMAGYSKHAEVTVPSLDDTPASSSGHCHG